RFSKSLLFALVVGLDLDADFVKKHAALRSSDGYVDSHSLNSSLPHQRTNSPDKHSVFGNFDFFRVSLGIEIPGLIDSVELVVLEHVPDALEFLLRCSLSGGRIRFDLVEFVPASNESLEVPSKTHAIQRKYIWPLKFVPLQLSLVDMFVALNKDFDEVTLFP